MDKHDIQDYMPCAWINANNPVPLSKGKFKYYYVEKEINNELSLFGVRNYEYAHPQTEFVKLTLDVSECIIKKAKEGTPEYSSLFLLLNSQKAIESSNFFKEYYEFHS